MKWCFRAGRPIADEEDSGDELHAVAGEDGVLRFAAEHSVEGTGLLGAHPSGAMAPKSRIPETETGAGARQGDQSQGDAAAAGVRTRMSPATRTRTPPARSTSRARRTWV